MARKAQQYVCRERVQLLHHPCQQLVTGHVGHSRAMKHTSVSALPRIDGYSLGSTSNVSSRLLQENGSRRCVGTSVLVNERVTVLFSNRLSRCCTAWAKNILLRFARQDAEIEAVPGWSIGGIARRFQRALPTLCRTRRHSLGKHYQGRLQADHRGKSCRACRL